MNPDAKVSAMPGIDGGTLRAWRRSRGWAVPELARRLRCAAGEADVPVATHDGLIRMIYAWERGDHQLTERYELLYAAVLPVSPAQLAWGPGGFGEPAAGEENGAWAGHTPVVGANPWELADVLTRSSVSMAALDFMERSVNALAAGYPFTAPSDLTPGVHAMLARVHDALSQPQPARVRTRCVRLGGILCGVAGQHGAP